MPLDIRTFTNADHRTGWRPGNNPGGHTLFKALGHPLTAPKAAALIDRLAAAGPIAVYDPTLAHGVHSSARFYMDC